jgi:nucleoid-associated protein YgaU
MMSSPRTKVGIAAAILIVGFGTAVLFYRHGPSNELPENSAPSGEVASAAKTSAVAAAPTTPAATTAPQAEPSLAGRIEPYRAYEVNPPPAAGAESAGNAAAGPSAATSNHSVVANNSTAELLPAEAAATTLAEFVTPRHAEAPAAEALPVVAKPASPARSDSFEQLFDRFDSKPAPASAEATRLLPARHKIVDGDTLTALAKKYLGNEERSLDLFDYNRDVLTSPELLPIGKELRIPPPGSERRVAERVETPATALVDVAALAINQARVEAAVPPIVASATPSSMPTAVTPATVMPATVTPAAAPAVGAAKSAPPTAPDTYIVQPHDTLALIARKIYGDLNRQSELLAANRSQLRSAKDLRPGMTLIVPAPVQQQAAGSRK